MIAASLLLIVVAVVLLATGLAAGSNGYVISSIVASLLAAVTLIVGGRQVSGTAAGEDGDGPADEPARPGRTARAGDLSSGGVPSEGVDVADRSSGGDGGSWAARSRMVAAERVPAGVAAGVAATRPEDTAMGSGTRPVSARIDPSLPRQVAVADADTVDAQDDRTVAREPDGTSATRSLQNVAGDTDLGEEDLPDEPPAAPVRAVEAARIARLTTEVYVIDGRPRYHLRRCVHLLGRQSEPLPVSEAVELGFTPCALCEPDATLLARANGRD